MNSTLVKFVKNKINTAVFMLICISVIGVVGYRLISGYSWIDAIYMTVITVATVGFGEVVPLDDKSKIFTVFLILASVIIVGYAISIITEHILSKSNIEELKNKKMQKKVDGFKNHVVVCGYGRNGKQVVRKGSHKKVGEKS
jgi:voltage-gated potassium channel